MFAEGEVPSEKPRLGGSLLRKNIAHRMIANVFHGTARKAVFTLLTVPFTVVAQTSGELRMMSDTYLEGDGSQAIDVGCTVGPKTRIMTEIYYEVAPSGGYTYYLFGVDGGRRDFVYLQNNDAALKACLNGAWSDLGVSTYMRSGVRYLHDFNNKSGKWTVTTGTSGMMCASKNLTAGTATSTVTLGIFTRAKGTSYDNGAPLMRVYSFKVYEDDVLIRDLIPYGYGALTGLVDRCTGKVYTDVRKSKKPFKIGTDAAYVVSDASCSEWLDTGYCLTPTTKIEADFSISQVRANMTIFGAGGGEGLGAGCMPIRAVPTTFALAVRMGNWAGPSCCRRTARIS